ncbi:MAG: XdhC family protein [Gammaproteobacteria bacterium]|nr:XdhC family protein [Gammaproteobacteria bacterium]
MDDGLSALCRFFDAAAARAAPLVLASVIATEGSTYAKAGARILIAEDGSASGILSGGCLEADLRARACRVLATGRPERVRYDDRGSPDPVLGLGLGCEGAMEIWLEPTRAPLYPGISHLADCHRRDACGALATVVGGEAGEDELGRHGASNTPGTDALGALLGRLASAASPDDRGDGAAVPAGLRQVRYEERTLEVFLAPAGRATRLLLCGAGPDAIPVHAFAAELGWRVTVIDHRPAYASPDVFARASQVLCVPVQAVGTKLAGRQFEAAVVMSHHLEADAAYLRLLARRPPRFVGLLGPAARRKRLFLDLGAEIEPLRMRIRGPVGLDIGARSPQAIALSIVAQIHAELAGRAGGAFGATSAD